MKAQAIALRRISSLGQADGHSLEAQQTSTIEMAKNLGVEIISSWDEIQTSNKGKNFGRKDMEEMLAFCKKNPGVKFVLIDFVNRLMREVEVMIYYKVLFNQLGVSLVFCDPAQHSLNTKDQYSKLMLYIEGYKAEQDNVARSETTIARMKARIRSGYYLSHPHQGYMTSDTPGLHVPDPVRFKLLQDACRHIIYDSYTVNQAVKWLNDAGYRTRGNRKMDINHFIELFMDRYYCGVIDINSEGWPKDIKGLHEPMLTVREHIRLVAVMTKRNPRTRHKHNPEFPMANLLRHEECTGAGVKEKFAGVMFNRGKRPSGRVRPKKPVYDCRNCRKRIPRDLAHTHITEHLARLELQPSPELFREALLKVWRNQRGSTNERIRVLQSKKQRIEQKIKETTIAYTTESNELIKASQRSLINEYGVELEDVNTDIVNTQSVELESADFVDFAMKFVAGLHENWWALSPENKKRGVQILFNGKIYANTSAIIRTPQLSSIYRLGTNKKDLGKVSLSNMVELPGAAPGSVGLSLLVVYRHSLFKFVLEKLSLNRQNNKSSQS